MTLIHTDDIVPGKSQTHLLIKSINATQNSKQVGRALMRTQPMVKQVVSGYPTHGKRHSSFYEGDHRNDNLPFFSICNYPIQSTIPQGYSLRNVVLNPETLHTSGRVYEVFKSTHLGELKGCKRSFQRKETKNKRPRRKEPKEVETYENKHVC